MNIHAFFSVIKFFFLSELAKMVNETVENREQGRLFAVVSIAAVQRRVTVEDIIIVEAEFPPNIGDRIRLEKVSLRFDTM